MGRKWNIIISAVIICLFVSCTFHVFEFETTDPSFCNYGLGANENNIPSKTDHENGLDESIPLSKDDNECNDDCKPTESNCLIPPYSNVASLDIITQPKLEYSYGETLDLTDTVLHIVWIDGHVDVCTYWDFDTHVIYTSIENGTVLDHSHNGLTILMDHVGSECPNRTEPLIISPSIVGFQLSSQPKLEYSFGETFDLNNTCIEVNWSNGSSEYVCYDSFGTYGFTTDPEQGEVLQYNRTLTIELEGTGYSEVYDIVVEYYHCVGYITDHHQNPLSGVQICLNGEIVVESDDSGMFEFYGEPVDGPVTISAHKEGYEFTPLVLSNSNYHNVEITGTEEADTLLIGLIVSISALVYLLFLFYRHRSS